MDQTPHKKTILVVDDEPGILSVVAEVLGGSEYTILTADTGAMGLQKSREFKGAMDLLLSDFQMTGMSGVDLATAMTLERPQLKVLLMSGFPEGMLVLNEGWHFLAKPFVTSQLRALVVGLISPERKSKFSNQPIIAGDRFPYHRKPPGPV
jgi:two-component system, cell cycle sensor histidine kinase and response regulator CckA